MILEHFTGKALSLDPKQKFSSLLFFQDVFFFLHFMKSSSSGGAPSTDTLCEKFRLLAYGEVEDQSEFLKKIFPEIKKIKSIPELIKLLAQPFQIKKMEPEPKLEVQLKKKFENHSLDSLAKARALFCLRENYGIEKFVESMELKNLIRWEPDLIKRLLIQNKIWISKSIEPQNSQIQVTYWVGTPKS